MHPNQPEQPLACARARALLARHGDGELDEVLAAPLRGHLLECPACRAVFADARNLKRWLVAPSPPPVPAGFADRVVALAFGVEVLGPVRPGLAAPPPDGEPLHLQRFVLTLTAVAATLLLLLALALSRSKRPAGDELVAEPLSDVLELLDGLNQPPRSNSPLELAPR